MQLPLTTHLPLASSSQQVLTRRLLPLYIAAFSQGLVLWAPIEKVFLKSLGFDQAALGLMAALLSPRLAYFATIPLVAISLGTLLTFQEPHLHHSDERISLKRHLRAIAQTLFQRGKTLPIVTVLLVTSLLLSVIFEFGPLWQLAMAAPVGLYGLANAAVLSAGGVGSWLSVRRMLSKPATIVGVAGLLMVSSLALVIVKHAVGVLLAQGWTVAGGVGVGMVFTLLLKDSLSSRLLAGAASPARATIKAINAAPNPTSTILTPTAFDGLFLD